MSEPTHDHEVGFERRQCFRLHIENLRSQPPVFHITPERYEAACARHPALASRVEVTIGWDLDVFDEAIKEANFLIGWKFPRQDLASTAPGLRWIHMTGAGIDHVMPLDWLPSGAVLTNNRGIHGPKAGEYAAMAILALNTRIPFYATSKELRRWERVFATAVTGKVLLIVGVGSMGAAAAIRARQLGLRVIGIRSSGDPHPAVDEVYRPDDLDRLLPRADFLLLTVPLTPRTRGLIGSRQLSAMKPTASLINMARAGVLDHDALAESLREGRLAGAVLDVFDPEPLSADSFLWDVPNLLITPHVSSDDADRYVPHTLDLFFNNLQRLVDGLPLQNQVDSARQY